MDPSGQRELPAADLASENAPDAGKEHRGPHAQRGNARVPGKGHDLEARGIESVGGVLVGVADTRAEADPVELAGGELLDEADHDLVGRVSPLVRVNDLIEDETEASSAVGSR